MGPMTIGHSVNIGESFWQTEGLAWSEEDAGSKQARSYTSLLYSPDISNYP
jgi:hypothetical protein